MFDKSFESVLTKNGYVVTDFRGTSMNPLLKEGRDRVFIVKPTSKLKKGDIALYVRPSGGYILHRVYKVMPSSYAMLGDSHFTVEYGVPFNAVIGVLQGYYKGEKYIDVNKSFSYKVYKFLWCSSLSGRKFCNFFRKIYLKIKRIFKKD
ncbi:MAG: S24/S26 family peptidase [Clostridia bacterium]|nr:S24/S26 family peptidase [Clostridia bacterium]